jgi:uncharacterized protein DUF4396
VNHSAAHAAAPAAPLNRLAISATTHCLTGCAIGEVAGMAIATAFGWGNLASIITAVILAYFFGFGLTAMPLIRALLEGAGHAMAFDEPLDLARLIRVAANRGSTQTTA